MFLYKEKLLNKLNTFVDESLSESKKSDDAILTGVVPTKDDIKLIIDAKTAFIANANDSAWAKKHFMQCPWGIAWNVSPVGRAPSAATALKYYLLALITDWTELETQLHRTLKQTYKFSVHEIEHITTVWDANIDAITVEVNNYLNTVTKTSITEHNVVNNNNPTQFYYLKPDIVFDIKRFNKKTIEALVELKHSNLPDMQLTQFVKRDADTNAWYSDDDKLRLLIIVLAMDWDQMFKILKKELKHYKYTKEDITAVFNYVADTTHIFDQVSALIHDAETEWSKHGSTKTFTKMYRVVLYDNGYTPPARRHVYITKTRPNGIRTIALGSSQMNSHSWYDEPLFDSAQQAQDFLDNLSKLQTRADTTRLSGKVTDKPIDGYVYNLDDALKVQTDLGPAYIHKRNGKFKEALREDVIDSDSVLFEDIEKHDTLNDKLFDLDTEKLRPEVKDKIEEIVSYFISDLAEDEIGIDVADIVLIGSNVSYNYTKDSDLDIHIIADTTNSTCPDNLYPKLYSAYRSLFNKKMNITLHGVPVELYVETEGVTQTVSNGIYSVMNDEWIKFPEHEDIPDIDMEEFDAPFAEWEDRYNSIVDNENLTEARTTSGNWRLSDGENQLLKAILLGNAGLTSHEFSNEKANTICHHLDDTKNNIFDGQRRSGIKNSNFDNLVFIKNNTKAIDKSTPQTTANSIHQLVHIMQRFGYNSIDELKDLVDAADIYRINPAFVSKLMDLVSEKLIDFMNTDEQCLEYKKEYNRARTSIIAKERYIQQILRRFIRTIRTGEAHWLKSIDSDDLKQTITFNDLLDLDTSNTSTTISTELSDANSKLYDTNIENNNFTNFAKIIKDWLEQRPIPESLTENVDRLNAIEQFIADIYDLRQKALSEEGEYSIGNLIFKEVRNRGWLDNLKDLQNQEKSKELSLEQLDGHASTPQVRKKVYESKFRGYLTNSEIYAYRQDLERKLNTSVQVFNNGHFTINNVRESNVDELLRRIENIDFVLEAHKIESGKYDFNRMNFITGIPAKYYTINGKINLER